MKNFLSESQLQQYEAEGYCYPFDILSDKELAKYLSKLDNYEAETGHAISGIYRHKPHLIFPWLYDVLLFTYSLKSSLSFMLSWSIA